MATRRMFSKTITNSGKFLKMPATSRLLYYDLGMNADDDGYAEWFTVLRMTGAAEQDLKVLEANGFVKVFDDNVLIILNWKENNYLRSDRYTPSKYVDTYKKVVGIPPGIPNGNQVETQVRLGKDRIGKDNIHTGEADKATERQKTDNRNPDIQELVEYGREIGLSTTKERMNRFAIARMIKKHGKDLTKKYALYSQEIRQYQYAPQINNWMDLEEKLLKLRDFAERQKKKSQQIVNIDL